MTRNTIARRLLLPVLAAIVVGVFGLGVAVQASSGGATGAVYATTDAHDRVDLGQVLGAPGANVNSPSDAHDRTRSAQEYSIACAANGLSGLSDRHTPEELRAYFWR
jgi:hypothetical protein